MKVTKRLQRDYLACFKNGDVETFTGLYTQSNEAFCPMYLVAHGFLNLEAAIALKPEMIKETIRFWDLGFQAQNKTFVIWLLEVNNRNRFSTSASPIPLVRLFLGSYFESLGDFTYDYLLKMKINPASFPASPLILKECLAKFPSRILEINGINSFMWSLRYGSDEDIKREYYPGAEFLKDEKGNKVLCFLPESRKKLREFFFQNTKILEDPEFIQLGIKLDQHSYVTRPYQGLKFKFSGDLKCDLGVTSKLFEDTLVNFCSFPISPSGEGREFTLDYFNAIYILKKKVPQIDENVLHNALKEVTDRKVKHLALNIENLEEIIDITWDLLNSYSEKRKLKMLLMNYHSLSSIQDIVRMVQSKAQTAQVLGIRLLPEKPKTFQEVHDHLVKIPENLEHNRVFSQDYSLLLDNYLENDFEIFFPKNEIDLILIGVKLKNCVGSEHYREAVVNKESQIFTIKKNGILKACVEIRVIPQSQGLLISVEQISGWQNEVLEPAYSEFVFRAFKDKLPEAHLSFPYKLPNEQDYYFD